MLVSYAKCNICGDIYPIDFGGGLGIIVGKCPKCEKAWRQVSAAEYIHPGALVSHPVTSPPAKPAQPQKPTNIQVILDKESRKQVSTEEIHMPPGVTIDTERRRTFERTIVLDWEKATNIRGASVGFKGALSGGIRKEIERQLGSELKEQETIAFNVGLKGKKNFYYTLTWTDVWREGTVQYQLGSKTQSLPIQFRERIELHIEQVPETRARSKK